jgi:Zn-dependent peptidase ImmA (M78 family)
MSATELGSLQLSREDCACWSAYLLTGYDRLQEEEVNWLAGCLLLPRDTLVYIKRRRIELADAAAIFGVSRRMLSYRLAATGVNRQFA